MSVEKARPTIVGFDGLHRTGKGVQTDLLHSAITEAGGSSIIMRGDGTREGLGLHSGDNYSIEWQQRSQRVKSPEGNTIEAWNAASFLLVNELSQTANHGDYDAIILDRTLISRAAFLLHRGIGVKGTRFALADMYPDNASARSTDQINLDSVVPDVIFDLQARSPHDLLARLDINDPKYQFRARNIRGGFDAALAAHEHLPVDIEERVEVVDASEQPATIHQKIKSRLAATALGKFF